MRTSETAILDLPVDVGSTDKTVNAPWLCLRDLVSPLGKDGQPDPSGRFEHTGAAAIYRDLGNRLFPLRSGVSGRDLVDGRAEAVKNSALLLKAQYRIEWSQGAMIRGARGLKAFPFRRSAAMNTQPKEWRRRWPCGT